jgi:hypothetical protein
MGILEILRIRKTLGVKKVRRQDGTIVRFDKGKITDTIFKAVRDRRAAEEFTNEVVWILRERYAGKIPTLNDIHYIVRDVLTPRRGQVRYDRRFGIFKTRIKGTDVEWDEQFNAWVDPEEHGVPGGPQPLTLWKDRNFSRWYRKWKSRKTKCWFRDRKGSRVRVIRRWI